MTVDGPLNLGVLLQAAYHGSPAYLAESSAALAAAPPAVWLAHDRGSLTSWADRPSTEDRWAYARRVVGEAPSDLAVALLSLDWNGYVRETAVARLADAGPALALPALALRCADHVTPVRERARAIVAVRLAADPAATVALVAPVAYALMARERGRWLAERVDELLHDGAPSVVDTALGSPDVRVRRSAYAIVTRSGRLDLDRLVAAVHDDPDVVVRRTCVAAAVRLAVESGRTAELRPFLTARSAAVRGWAVHAFALAGDVAPAAAALPDRSAAVREVAQHALRRTGADLATAYRMLVAADPSAGAVTGLGETGTAEDATLLRPFLADARPGVRAAAVRALRRLGAAPAEIALPMLRDSSAAVAREAAAALVAAPSVDLVAVRALLRDEWPDHVRRAAFRVLAARGHEERVRTDLALLAGPPGPLRDRARDDLLAWVSATARTAYVSLSGERAREFEASLARAAPVLDRRTTDLLRFYLGLPAQAGARQPRT